MYSSPPPFITCDAIERFSRYYRFLSNFYLVTIIHDNREWPSSEHLFQASKTYNVDEQEKIRSEESPNEAKKLGRTVEVREDWNEVKLRVMYDCLNLKFNQNPNLKEELVNTYPMKLIEGNHWHDNFWGNCNCKRCKNKEGKNFLGLLLEKVRVENIIYIRRWGNGDGPK